MTELAEDTLTTLRNDGTPLAGLSGQRRVQLMALHRAFDRPFDALQAASVLAIDLDSARRLLASLADGGWLARCAQGVVYRRSARGLRTWAMARRPLDLGSHTLRPRLHRLGGALLSTGGSPTRYFA